VEKRNGKRKNTRIVMIAGLFTGDTRKKNPLKSAITEGQYTRKESKTGNARAAEKNMARDIRRSCAKSAWKKAIRIISVTIRSSAALI